MTTSKVPSGIITALAVLAAALAGCAAARTSGAIDRAELVKAATFDHDCPERDIHLLGIDDGPLGSATEFDVEVCGARRHYKKIGMMFVDADRKPLTD